MASSGNSSDPSRFPFVPGTPPVTVVGAEGNYLHTADGRRILDAAGGAIVNNIGYGRPEIAETAAKALTGSGYTVPLFATEARLALLDRLVGNWLPPTMTRAMFVNGGSESVDSAIRISRQHHVAKGNTDKWKVLGRATSYHGATLASLSVANHDRRREGLGPLLMDLPKVDNFDAEQVIKTIETEDPASVAALIMEPVTGASGGAQVAPDDYWPTLRQYTADNNILLIADEVMSGFGRTGRKFGVDNWDVVPDILVGAKGLAGGYAPMGGVFATEAVAEPLIGHTVMYFTFSGADLSCAIADRVLQILEDEDLVARAATMGTIFRSMLEERFGDHPHVADIRGLGLLQGLEFTKDRSTGASYNGQLAPLVNAHALARDCWIYPAGSALVPDAAMFGPSFTVTAEELEKVVDITAESLDAAIAELEALSPRTPGSTRVSG